MGAVSTRSPYDLRDANGASHEFYRRVERLADSLSAEIDQQAGSVLHDYAAFVTGIRGEQRRSREEYGVELLTLGLERSQYAGAARRTPRFAVGLASALYRWRSRFPRCKRAIDSLRGALSGLFFVPALAVQRTPPEPTLVELDRLLRWLEATGEFKEETLRLQSWRAFLASLPEGHQKAIIQLADELFEEFRFAADEAFRDFTRGLVPYQLVNAADHRWREDALLIAKSAEEYHLNMVASELMNRGLRSTYELTRQRVVLVPGCMRARPTSECQAVTRGTDIICTGCEPNCHVHELQERGRRDGFRVRIVPHATSFTRWLERYQSDDSTGLIPVACPLHLVAGGYEVRRLGLRAQCVLLDYCGCSKHWNREGIPTAVCPDRVSSMARAGRG